MQARQSIVMQWNYILLVLHYLVLIMLNARLWDYSFLGWSLLNLLLAFSLHQVWSLLVHPKTFKPVLPHESTISTYMRYSFAVLSKFACAVSNFQNEFLFCVLYRLLGGEGWPIFSMLDVLFSRWVFIHLSLHESMTKVLGMPSPKMKNEFTLCRQIINSLESVGMEGTHGYS